MILMMYLIISFGCECVAKFIGRGTICKGANRSIEGSWMWLILSTISRRKGIKGIDGLILINGICFSIISNGTSWDRWIYMIFFEIILKLYLGHVIDAMSRLLLEGIDGFNFDWVLHVSIFVLLSRWSLMMLFKQGRKRSLGENRDGSFGNWRLSRSSFRIAYLCLEWMITFFFFDCLVLIAPWIMGFF